MGPLSEEKFFQVFGRQTKDADRCWASLCDRYAEPHRAYHTGTHIEAMFRELATFDGVRPTQNDALCVAILMHDMLYEPRAIGNEYRSAVNAGNICRHLGRPELVEMVKQLILSTRDHTTSRTGFVEFQLLSDLDLSIFGQDEKTFREFDEGIQEEYRFVPPHQYRRVRARILDTFHRRERIYLTWHFHQKYDAAARENLRRAVLELTDGLGVP